jgi:hypothetical protein
VHSSRPLGDVRAESDKVMLDEAFFESSDYRTLVESSERFVVVGRRGAGKSALVYKLGEYWRQADKTVLRSVAPEEDQLFGLRALAVRFGDRFALIRAASRIAWRHALFLEVAEALSGSYRYKRFTSDAELDTSLREWRGYGNTIVARLRGRLKDIYRAGVDSQEMLADLNGLLKNQALQDSIARVLEATHEQCILLIDKVDEGYEADEIGVALVDGLVQATIDVNNRIPAVRASIFLRDNIFRSVAKHDPDYSRNVEGQVLRLHWDETQLFNMVCKRLRVAFGIDVENDRRVWNQCTARDLEGMDGFRKCLQYTLYRPRDLVVLLNEAFLNAAKASRTQIVPEDVEAAARSISIHRLDDLHKEYTAIIPGINGFTETFANGTPELTLTEAEGKMQALAERDDLPAGVREGVAIFDTPAAIVRALYSVGFIGVKDSVGSTFLFCHDGRAADREFRLTDRMLIHPCYWIALNLSRSGPFGENVTEINDEYDIGVASETKELRDRRLGQVIGSVAKIPEGADGSGEFEHWCLTAVKIAFAGGLRNTELHPNKNQLQRRDVVATNLAETAAWKRILEDYGARQVIFEVKNYAQLTADDYRQVLSYSGGEYGRLAFVVCRDMEMTLRSGGELDWFRELYFRDPKLVVVKLTARWLSEQISKLRSVQKHDAPDKALNGLLDQYARVYCNVGRSLEKKKGVR